MDVIPFSQINGYGKSRIRYIKRNLSLLFSQFCPTTIQRFIFFSMKLASCTMKNGRSFLFHFERQSEIIVDSKSPYFWFSGIAFALIPDKSFDFIIDQRINHGVVKTYRFQRINVCPGAIFSIFAPILYFHSPLRSVFVRRFPDNTVYQQ